MWAAPAARPHCRPARNSARSAARRPGARRPLPPRDRRRRRSPSGASSASCSPTSSASRPSPRGATRRSARPADAATSTLARERHRAVRRHGREVHRRRGHGRLGRAGGPRGRRGAGRPGRRWSWSTRCAAWAAARRPASRRAPAVLTGEAAVTIGATDQGMVAGDLVNTASRLQSVAAAGHRAGRRGDAARGRAAAIAFEPAGEQCSRARRARCRPGARCAWWPSAAARAATRASSRRSSAATTSCACSRTCSTPRRATDGRASSRSPARPASARAAWRGSSQKYIDGLVGDRLLAPRPLAGLRRGHHLLGAGRDGPPPSAGWRRPTTRQTTARAARARRSPSIVAGRRRARAGSSRALLALLGLGRRPPGERDELFAAWRTFFERIAARAPTVLVFEDLQWADAGLLDFIDHLLEWSRGLPDPTSSPWRDRSCSSGARLGRGQAQLRGAGTRAAARRRRCGAARGPGARACRSRAVRAIVDRADGVPLYAVETVRMLVAEGGWARRRRLRAVAELDELAVPETLQALIAARLDALDPADRALLQDGGGARPELHARRAGGVARRAEADAGAALAASSGASCWPRDGPRSPERGQYGFVQALIREVAYGTLAGATGARGTWPRRATSRRSATTSWRAPGDPLPGRLPRHRRPAPRPMRSRPRRASRCARRRSGRAALGSSEQALAYLRDAINTITDEPGERAALDERAVEASGSPLADGQTAIDLLDDVIAHYRERGDRLRRRERPPCSVPRSC